MTVIAAFNDPLAVLLSDDLPDMMTPYDNRANGGTAGIGAVVGPGSREVVLGTRIGSNLTAHVPSAPGRRPPPATGGAVTRLPVTRTPITCALVT